jgi:short-subunit dehydrogenase
LTAIQKEIGNKLYARYMDVARPDEARALLQSLVHEMGGVDIVVVNAGTGTFNMSWQAQKQILDVNVIGFTAMVTAAAEYFTQKGEGHIVGVSSIAALKGFAQAPAYSASKAFESNYLEGLRGQFKKKALPILVTTVEPGAVDTAMYKGTDFWRATPEKAAEQICDAIENGKEHVYITKRWRLVAWIFKLLPTPIFHKIF